MYGLLLKNLQDYVVSVYGEKKWEAVKDAFKITTDEFPAKDIFPEGQLIKMGKKAMANLEMKDEEFYEGMGVYFIKLTQVLGFFKFIEHLGRELRDFFLNLDNLHDYLKFTFPRLKPPSFFVQDETEKSMTLQYRSKRRGFQFYVQGQTKELAKQLFGTKVQMKLQKQEVVFDTVICTYTLEFDNAAYRRHIENLAARKEASLPIRASTLFEMFPFCILFQKDLTVSSIGIALRQVIPHIVGKKITSYFELVKPLIEFNYENIESRSNNMFELATQEEIDKLGKSTNSSSAKFDDEIDLEEEVDKTLHIKGQMTIIQEWGQVLFLACPIMKDLNNLIWCGLFVNDLSMHDYSRDIMLATSQEQIEMRMALANAELRGQQMNNQLKKIDDIVKKTDELLYQMIPKTVAERLRKGESPMDTCEVFESVTMLFSDIVGFTTICSRIQPPQVVQFLNTLYTLFDFLVDQNQVYKVETIGDAYLIVAGCPVKVTNHALKICDMAFDMMDGIKMLRDPGTGDSVEMRIGCHSGPVVAGIVGLKMPRYCLFGLNVGLTEKFESNSKPMRIHVSEPCKQLLSPQYKFEQRDDPELREKVGGHVSHFLNSKDGRQPLKEAVIKALLPTDAERPKLDNKKDKKKEESKPAEPAKAEAKPPEAKKAEAEKPAAAAEPPKPAAKEASSAPAPPPPAAPKAAAPPPVASQPKTPPPPPAAAAPAASAPSAPAPTEPEASDESPAAPAGGGGGTMAGPSESEEAKHDENENETKAAETESIKMTPAFPNGRRVSQVQTQCCNGFQESGVCQIL